MNNRYLLANILIGAIDEYKDMSVAEVVNLIEGEIMISKVPVEPGLTNTEFTDETGNKIVGMNTENIEQYEGIAIFDVLFYAKTKAGLSKIIINIEAQKGKPKKYNLMNRATFYSSRMISSQKEREFIHMNYDDIKRTYSIWLCMNAKQDYLSYTHLVQEDIIGDSEIEKPEDLINIVFLGIKEVRDEKDKTYLGESVY